MTAITKEQTTQSIDRLLSLRDMLKIGEFVASHMKDMDPASVECIGLNQCLERYFQAMSRELEPATNILLDLEDQLRRQEREAA